ncbi:GNAT family N-acetyltransferase [Bernardetia sp.]|uniref:GNAT family N-acetyltransferase n=1 Tax=Bernardetia sp. TaxID=1937974 RepID=UPI0025BE6992|nr:GNAT family N-acetyltransferase [Bernardetia sp.]
MQIENSKESFKIVDYRDDLSHYIKTLNYEWLERYFHLEEGDIISLSNPKKEIIDKGGYIFFVEKDSEIIGTASLLKKNTTVFELGKMAITEKSQGKGIGKALLTHCLDFAKSHSISIIILYSNTKLESAIRLYKKIGFKEIPLEKGLYERANIKMQLDMKNYNT